MPIRYAGSCANSLVSSARFTALRATVPRDNAFSVATPLVTWRQRGLLSRARAMPVWFPRHRAQAVCARIPSPCPEHAAMQLERYGHALSLSSPFVQPWCPPRLAASRRVGPTAHIHLKRDPHDLRSEE